MHDVMAGQCLLNVFKKHFPEQFEFKKTNPKNWQVLDAYSSY